MGEGSGAATLRAAVVAMTRAFASAGLDTPGLDARRLACFVLGLDPVSLLREPERALVLEELSLLAAVTERRLAREPVSRIMGVRAFHGMEFAIGPSTLDPRPDTETLVDAVIELVREEGADHRRPLRILDLGTGSGAILLALLESLPHATGVGVDVSDEALAISTCNAVRLGLAARARFQRSDWLQSVEGQFDVVVSNPPYIASAEVAGLEAEVRLFDPLKALDGGGDGLDAYRLIAREVSRAVVPGGWVAVEIGAGQRDDVAAILREGMVGSGAVEVRAWTDLSGLPRCVAVRARM